MVAHNAVHRAIPWQAHAGAEQECRVCGVRTWLGPDGNYRHIGEHITYVQPAA